MPVAVSFWTPPSGDRSRNAEIRHERVAARQQDVLRLDVTMNDALRMRVAERVVHLEGERDGVVDGQHSFPIDAIAQRLALHEGHDIVQEVAGHAGVMQPEDVRVLQLGGKPNLALEAARPRRPTFRGLGAALLPRLRDRA